MNASSTAAISRVRNLVNELGGRSGGWTYSLVAPPGSGKATAAVLLIADMRVKHPDQPVLVVSTIESMVRYGNLLDGAGVPARRWDLADLHERLSSGNTWEPIVHLVSDESAAGSIGNLLSILPWSLVVIDGKGVLAVPGLIEAVRERSSSRLFMIQTQKSDRYAVSNEWTSFDADFALPERRIVSFRRTESELSAIVALPRIAAWKAGLLEKLDAAAASSLSALLNAINRVDKLSVEREADRLAALESLSSVAADEKVSALLDVLRAQAKGDTVCVVLSSSPTTLAYLETCLADNGLIVCRHMRGQVTSVVENVILSNYTSVRNLEVQDASAIGGEVDLLFVLYDLPEDLETWLEVMAMVRRPAGSAPATIVAFQDETGGTTYEQSLLKRWRFLAIDESKSD